MEATQQEFRGAESGEAGRAWRNRSEACVHSATRKLFFISDNPEAANVKPCHLKIGIEYLHSIVRTSLLRKTQDLRENLGAGMGSDVEWRIRG